MFNIGVMTSSGLENFFIEEEISHTSTERIGFVGLKSILKCGDSMKTCKIDAYITTLSGHEQTLGGG